jgi:hypothetical protein
MAAMIRIRPETEDRLESAWRRVLEGRGDAAEFYRLLDEWEELHQRMIELRKSQERSQ